MCVWKSTKEALVVERGVGEGARQYTETIVLRWFVNLSACIKWKC